MEAMLLLTDRQQDIIAVVLGGASLILILGAGLILTGYGLLFVFMLLYGAYHALLQTVIAFFVSWGVLSLLVNFLEGGRDKYGWAGFVAMIAAIAIGGFMGMDEAESKSS